MINEKSSINSNNENPDLNINHEIVDKINKDLEKEFNYNSNNFLIPENSIPTTISSIQKKINSRNMASNNVSDSDLLISMTKRLNIIEKQLSDERKSSKEAELRIAKLTKENIQLKQDILNSKTICNPYKPDSYNCTNCRKLKTYIVELTNYANELREFIKENGFVILNQIPSIENCQDDADPREFIENDQNTRFSKTTEKCDADDDYDDSSLKMLPKEIDIEILSRRIEELNILLLKDGQTSRFEMDGDKIFKLKRQKEVKIFFYKNGLIIEGYKFYEYITTEAKKILHDILDGYTPYILKNDYSDGVLLSLVNNVHLRYDNQNKNSHNVKCFNDPNAKKGVISGQEFLKKFPEKVIRNGKIYNIRDDMENFLVVKRDNEYNFDAYEHFVGIDKAKENEFKDSICRIKIKIIHTDKIINVNVIKFLKIKVLFEFMQRFLKFLGNETVIENFCFYSTYPLKQYFIDDDKTFQENGLFPSYFLIFDLKEKFLNK